MLFVYDDGGRKAAGYKGTTGDCACRAVAIAAQRPYQEVYDLINEYAKKERTGKRKRKVSNARTGVYQTTMLKVMSHYGFKWVATMHIGQGCTVHLREDELPRGRLGGTIWQTLRVYHLCQQRARPVYERYAAL